MLSLFAAAPFGVAPITAVRPGLSVVTLNMAKESSAGRVLREFRSTPALRDADVFLLQEVREGPGQACVAARLGSALGLHVAYAPAGPGITDQGLAILSRFPLRDIQIRSLKVFDLRFHTRARFALAATADTPWGPVRLSDTHLDTRLNRAERLAQLEPVVRDSATFQGRRILGGDFNSNPFYWVEHILPLPAFRSQAYDIEKFMTLRGFQTAIPESATTFDYLRMHLDWIWLAGLRPAASGVVPLNFSDHHAVWTHVEF